LSDAPRVAVDVQPERLDLAKELGATRVVDAGREDPVAAIRDATGGGVLYSLECTGLPKVFRQAVDCLILTGICGLIGVSPVGTKPCWT
jgi:aryl-alcohol dehydrogenase